MRMLSMNLSVTAVARTGFAFKHKDHTGKVLLEGKSEDYFYYKKGEWRRRERTIDHVKKWYKEIFRDAKTDKILYAQEEPLDQHVGHGSDKTSKNRLKRKYKELIHFFFGAKD